jgi:hypothetical protein
MKKSLCKQLLSPVTSLPDDGGRDSFQNTGNSLQSIFLEGLLELSCHEIIKPYTALYCLAYGKNYAGEGGR